MRSTPLFSFLLYFHKQSQLKEEEGEREREREREKLWKRPEKKFSL